MRNLESCGLPEAIPFVSSTESLRAKLRRAKRKAKTTTSVKVPTTWSDLKKTGIPDQFKFLQNGSSFLRFLGPVTDGKDEQLGKGGGNLKIDS